MTGTARLRAILTAAAFALGAAGVAGYFIPNPERTWPDGPIEVHEQLTGGPAGALLDGSSTLNVAFESAIQTWNQYLGRVQFVPVRNSPAAIGDGNDINNIILSDTVFGRAFDEHTLAVTSRWFDTRTNRRLEFDIVFNSKWSWNSYRGPLRTDAEDIVRVGLHQLGLALGLSDPEADGQIVAAIMNSTVGDLDTLTFDDISGALSLYSAADPAPGAFRQIKTQTDATGTATFTIAADRTVQVRFVDHNSGSGIPGADAYLFTEPNGIAMAGMTDPIGRYFTQLAPIRLPVTVTGATTAQVRPIEVPVPLVNPPTPSAAPNVVVDWISDNLVGSAWSDVQRRATNLMNDLKAWEVVVDREVTLSEIADDVDVWQEILDHGLGLTPDAVQVTVDAAQTVNDLRTSPAHVIWKVFNPLGKVEEAHDRVWQSTKMTLGHLGYGPNQRFTLRVVRVPFDLPEPVRKSFQWQIYVTALDNPERPWVADAEAGVITGHLVDATDGKPLQGVITLTGPDPRIYTKAGGYFASKPVPPGFYHVNGHARGYRSGREDLVVRGDAKIETVTIRLVPIGVSKVVVEPATQTIRENQGTSFRGTVYGMDDKPMAPQPRLIWQSHTRAVATIEQYTGIARAVKPGSASITAATYDGYVSAPATLIVERSTPCPYTLSNTRFTSTDAGGTANVTVTTEPDCAWTAVPSPTSMMSVTSGGSGPGTGTFRLSVSRNTSATSRTGIITIQSMPAPNTVTVTQSGTAPACTITLSRTSVSVGAAAASGFTVGVTAATGCAWTASGSSFVTVTSGTGPGTGTVTFSVSANTGAARSATLTIGGQVVTVSQAAGGTTTGTTLTSSLQCVRGTQGGGIYNNLTCTGTASLRLGAGFTSGAVYVGIFTATGESGGQIRTQNFTAGSVGSTYQLSVTGKFETLDPTLPRCPSTQTLIGFYRVPQNENPQAQVVAPISVPVSCN